MTAGYQEGITPFLGLIREYVCVENGEYTLQLHMDVDDWLAMRAAATPLASPTCSWAANFIGGKVLFVIIYTKPEEPEIFEWATALASVSAARRHL